MHFGYYTCQYTLDRKRTFTAERAVCPNPRTPKPTGLLKGAGSDENEFVGKVVNMDICSGKSKPRLRQLRLDICYMSSYGHVGDNVVHEQSGSYNSKLGNYRNN